MDRKTFTQTQLTHQILDLGIKPNGVLLVHCAFSKVKPVENGAIDLISALQNAIGEDGTLVMPSMTNDDDHPFDPKNTDCIGMGIVAHIFWQMPNTLRSDNPHAFSARGPKADQITAPHPIDIPHGLDSPVGRIYELDGQVLLLGVGQDSNTTIHLAEHLAGVRYRHEKYVTILDNGQYKKINYLEIDHCCQKFNLVDQWLEEEGLLLQGAIGNAKARLMNSRDIVRRVTKKLETTETIFLHPFGFDEDCDIARSSLKQSGT
jgi:aminoglycoside 3-N-acetyltransferase